MLTRITLERSLSRHGYISSFDFQSLAVHKKLGHFAVGGFENAAKGLPRDPHSLRRGIVIETYRIGQLDGLKLVEREDNFLQLSERQSHRLEVLDVR